MRDKRKDFILNYSIMNLFLLDFLASDARLTTEVYNPQLQRLPNFDIYLLAQSWQPEFCQGKLNEYPGCQQPVDYWRNHFTLHGLWPELVKGPHPGFCGGEDFDSKKIESALGIDTLVQYWPDVKHRRTSPEYPEFWEHEWTRHGTCSGLDQVTYFSCAIKLVQNGAAITPSIVQQNVGKNVSAEKLREGFGGHSDVVLKCAHGGVLSQVFTCWNKDAKNLPTTRRECPDHVLNEDTCIEGTIFIPSF
jgi:ribonuclease T2